MERSSNSRIFFFKRLSLIKNYEEFSEELVQFDKLQASPKT